MNSPKFLAFLLLFYFVPGFAATQPAIVSGNDATKSMAVGEISLIQHLGSSPGFRKLIEGHSADKLIGPDGAIGRNKGSYIDAAEQRGGEWYLMRGVIDDDPRSIARAIQTMEYGFAHQNSVGYFENTLGASPTKAVEADAFFLQAFARIALVVRASPYRQQFEPRLVHLTPQLSSAMHWLAQNTGELQHQDHNAVNRLWFDAMAFTLNGTLLNDPYLIEIGRTFMDTALQEQRQNGSFNEHGGADSSYQAVSMLNIAVLLSYETDPVIAGKLKASLMRATEWETLRIDGNGHIDASGNSRTGLGQEMYFGKAKDINYQEVAQALFYASDLLGMPPWRNLAEAVTARDLRPRE